jgi:hypothetical protein
MNTNNNLENQIKEHAEEIFGNEPLTGHRDRFAAKLVAAREKDESLSGQSIQPATAAREKDESLSGQRNQPIATNSVLSGQSNKSTQRNPKQRNQSRQIYRYLSIAAVFAGLVIFFHHIYNQGGTQEGESLSEVQNYYSMQLQDKIEDIEQLLQQVSEEDRPALLQDLENMLTEADAEIQSTGKKNPELIVMTYSFKIEALEHIHDMLVTNL